MNLPSLDLAKVRAVYAEGAFGVVTGRERGSGRKRERQKTPREKRLGFGEVSRLHESGPRSVRGIAPSSFQGATSTYTRAPLTSRNTLATIGVGKAPKSINPGTVARHLVARKQRSESLVDGEFSSRQDRSSSKDSVPVEISECTR